MLSTCTKVDSERLLSKVRTTPGTLPSLKVILNRYLVLPVGITDLGECVFMFLDKPTRNTEYIILSGKPVIYDRTIVDETLKRIDFRYDNYFRYKPSKENDPDHLFRGMSGNEFNDMIEKGAIESDKRRNLTGQQEVTCFAKNLSKAFIYAYTMNTWRDNPTFGSPNYVVKVKQHGIDYALNIAGEAEVKNSVPVSNLVAVWEIRLAASSPGIFSIIEGPDGDVRDGHNWRFIDASMAVREFTDIEINGIKAEI